MSLAPLVTADVTVRTIPRHHESRLRRHGMRLSIIESLFANIHVTLTGPHFITGFLLMIGATDWHIGLVAAMPHFLQIFQLVAAYVTAQVGSRRVVCMVGVVMWRGMHVLMALLPFLPWLHAEDRIRIVCALIFISSLATMFVANSWVVWMADLVPVRVRGRYFGMRSGLALGVSTFWALIGGVLLDQYRAGGMEKEAYLLLFGCASAFAFVSLLILRRQWEPPMRRESPPSLRRVAGILHNPNFRRICVFCFLWNFGVGISAAFFTKYFLTVLHMNFSTIMVYPVLVNVVGFLCARRWGRLMDTIGTKNMLFGTSLMVAFLPLIYLFASPGNLWPVWIDAVGTGLFWTGMGIATSNLPLVITPNLHKGHYVGVFVTICGAGIGIASVLSGKIAMVLAPVSLQLPWLDHPLINYHLMFVASTVLRLVSLLFLLRVRDASTYTLSDSLRLFASRVMESVRLRRPVSNSA